MYELIGSNGSGAASSLMFERCASRDASAAPMSDEDERTPSSEASVKQAGGTPKSRSVDERSAHDGYPLLMVVSISMSRTCSDSSVQVDNRFAMETT